MAEEKELRQKQLEDLQEAAQVVATWWTLRKKE
jgi:hypothetical protein